MELGEHAEESVGYFNFLATLVADAKIADQITVGNWRLVNNKAIYKGYSEAFPVPKVEIESGISYKRVWRCLSNPCLTSGSRETLYLLIHNKLPVKERIFRIRLATDPYCEYCFDMTGAEICDVDHFFCACQRVSKIWKRLKMMILGLQIVDISDFELINLRIPRNIHTNEVLWLLGIYKSEVWNSLVARGVSEICEDQFFGFLRFKYKKGQLGARMPLQSIQGLL